MKYLIIVFSITVLASCADDNFPDYVELKNLRVLALQAGASGAPAEYSPGDVVTITPYVSDYYGGTRPLNYSAVACLDPGVAIGAEPSCTGIPGAVSVGSGVAATPATSRSGSTTSFAVTVPATILAQQSTQNAYNGVNYLVTYTLSAGNETVHSFKRIVVSVGSKTSKNNNPQLTTLLSNGAAVGALPSGDVELSVSYPGSSIEAYDAKNADLSVVNMTEQLTTTWFITDGELVFFRTVNDGTTTYTPPSAAPSGRNAILIGVTRDDRGGVSVLVHQY